MKGEFNSTIFQVGRTLIFLQLQTQRNLTYQCMRGPARVAGEVQDHDDYLQLRKDAMRIPKQFYFKVKGTSEDNDNMDNYFSFNAVTEEGKD